MGHLRFLFVIASVSLAGTACSGSSLVDIDAPGTPGTPGGSSSGSGTGVGGDAATGASSEGSTTSPSVPTADASTGDDADNPASTPAALGADASTAANRREARRDGRRCRRGRDSAQRRLSRLPARRRWHFRVWPLASLRSRERVLLRRPELGGSRRPARSKISCSHSTPARSYSSHAHASGVRRLPTSASAFRPEVEF